MAANSFNTPPTSKSSLSTDCLPPGKPCTTTHTTHSTHIVNHIYHGTASNAESPDSINLCYVLDCSGSMHEMPDNGLQTVRDAIETVKRGSVEITERLIEFGTDVRVIPNKKIASYLDKSAWNCQMGQTALWDAVKIAIEECNYEGILVIVTDGQDNNSKATQQEMIHLLKRFRQNGKVYLIGLCENEDRLKMQLGGEVDRCIAINPRDRMSYMNMTQTIDSKCTTDNLQNDSCDLSQQRHQSKLRQRQQEMKQEIKQESCDSPSTA